jgi:hypothetical protein
MTMPGRALIVLRGDMEMVRALRHTWAELDIVRTWNGYRAYRWNSTNGEPIATGRTPAELGDRIKKAWIASGRPR